MRLIFLLLILNFGNAIDVKISEDLTKVIKDNYQFGLDIAFKKNDRKTSFYVTAKTDQKYQIIGYLDLRKDKANISRFITLKGLDTDARIDKIALLPNNKAWGLDTHTNIIYKLSLSSGEVFEKKELKIQSKIYDLVYFNKLYFLTDSDGLSLVELDLENQKTSKINLTSSAYTNASVVLLGNGRYLILASNNEKNEIFVYEKNTLKLLDAWQEKDIAGITLLDDAKTIAYLKHNEFTLRKLPEAVIVWGDKEWFLVGILSIIMLSGFIFLFRVIFK